MAAISTWSTTAASNNSASPDGSPEGWAPSEVNAWARETMAAVRTWYESAEWIDFGHTITYISGTQFSTAAGDGDTTGVYQVGRRFRETGSLGGPFYGEVSASSHSSVTTVTVVLDSGALDASMTAAAVGAASVTNPSISTDAISDAGTAATLDFGTASGEVPVIGTSSATTALAGLSELATQAEMEAATDTARVPSVSVVKDHPGVAKAWCKITFSGGTPSVAASYNVDSIIDDGVGQVTINWDTDFSSADYAVTVSMDSLGADADCSVSAQAAGSIQVTSRTAGTNQDRTFYVAAYGDH